MDADGSSLFYLPVGCRHSCSVSRHYICMLNLKIEFFSRFLGLWSTLVRDHVANAISFFARSAQSGHMICLCSGLSGHSVHPWVPLSHGTNEISSFGFHSWQSMLPKDHKVCARVFVWYGSNHAFKENSPGVCSSHVTLLTNIYFQIQHVSLKRRHWTWKKSNSSECNTGSDPDFWPVALISVKYLPWSSCSPIKGDVSRCTANKQSGKHRDVFIKQLWDIKLFILTLFSNSSEAQGESLRSKAPSLYCFPSVGLIFRIYMYSSLGSNGDFTGEKTHEWNFVYQWRV